MIDRLTVARLRVLARGARSHRKGPWYSIGGAVISGVAPADVEDCHYYGGALVAESLDPSVALMVAACDPETLIALCDAVETLTWQAAEKVLLPAQAST